MNLIKKIWENIKFLCQGSWIDYGSDWAESLTDEERQKIFSHYTKPEPCPKCSVAEAKGEVHLGHGSMKLRRLDKEYPEFSKTSGFKCQWVIESDKDYQFVKCCPICGKELKI